MNRLGPTPRASTARYGRTTALGVGLCFVFALAAACTREAPPDPTQTSLTHPATPKTPATQDTATQDTATQNTATQSTATQSTAIQDPATQGAEAPASGSLRCTDLRPDAAAPVALAPEIIVLGAPRAAQQIVLSKTGIVVSFSRDDFLVAARCLGLPQAVEYLEKETASLPETKLRDAFGLSYVAAALLDVGRVKVEPKAETEPRTSIVRDGWSAQGCAGACRSHGRLYRLSASDPGFFFRVTDRTVNTVD